MAEAQVVKLWMKEKKKTGGFPDAHYLQELLFLCPYNELYLAPLLPTVSFSLRHTCRVLLPLCGSFYLYICSCLQNDMVCADYIILSKGKLSKANPKNNNKEL